jgi:hypothetical protein
VLLVIALCNFKPNYKTALTENGKHVKKNNTQGYDNLNTENRQDVFENSKKI